MQFDFPDVNGNPYKSSGGKMVWNTDLDYRIPYGWFVGTFKELISDIKGGDWGNSSGSDTSIKVNCIRGADIPAAIGQEIMKAPIRFIEMSNCKKCLAVGDLVVEISGGSPTQSTGRIIYVNNGLLKRFPGKVTASNFCRVFSLKDFDYQFFFFHHWSNFYNSGLMFCYEGKTSGLKNLQFDSLCESVKIHIPPKHIIQAFNEQISVLYEKIQMNCIENATLQNFKDWLLPMLMNGQATVED